MTAWVSSVFDNLCRPGGGKGRKRRVPLIVRNDIGQLIRQELSARASVGAESGEVIAVTDAHGMFVSVNRAFTEVTGSVSTKCGGKNPRILQSGAHAGLYSAMWQQLATTGSWQGEVWNRRKSGEIYPEWLNISAVRNPAGEITHYVAIFPTSPNARRRRRASNTWPITTR